MDYLEIVSVRLASSQDIEAVIRFCREALTSGTTGRFELYRSLGSGTDLSVHIHRTLGNAEGKERSLLGLQLARGLGDYGLVSHTLWVDQRKELKGKNSMLA